MITNTSTLHERIFAEIKRLSTAGLDGPELLRRTAEGLGQAVPFEVYFAATMDPSSNLITHHIAGAGEDKDRALYLDQIYFEEDLDFISAMVREGRPIALLSQETGGKLERSLRYRKLRRPLGFGHELGSLFMDGNAWGGMDIIRAAGDPDFTDREIQLVNRIAPHVGTGLKAATLRRAAITEPTSDDAPGVLTLDLRGRVPSHTPSAQSLLSELEELSPDWRERNLPVSVTMVSHAVRRSLAPESDRDLNLIPRMRVRARSGRWLTLYGSLTESIDDRPSETVIVIEPTKPEEVVWLNVAAYALSPREEEVVKIVVRGLSNRQLSRSLFISENTVQRHLSNIFEKVGVRSRKELLKRLFFENLLPGMLGD